MKKIYIILILGLCLYCIAFIFYFNNMYSEVEEINNTFEIISLKTKTNYYNKYICADKHKSKFIIYDTNEYFPGDILRIKGVFRKADEERNYKGFNYRNYLKQSKIQGIIEIEEVKYIKSKRDFYYYLGKINTQINNKIDTLYSNKVSSFLKGILIGNTSEIEDTVKDNFRKSSVSHILAISGLHVSYIVSGIKVFISKFINSKRKQNILLIIFLLFFCALTGGSPSCTRACIMNSIALFGEVIYKKNNTYINLFIALYILIIINPYNLLNIGMWLSFLGTLSILIYDDFLNKLFFKKANYIFGLVATSLSVQILILPIIIYNYNSISLTFFIPNILISFIIGPILILGYISIFIPLKILVKIEEILVSLTFKIAENCSKLPLSNIYLKTPNLILIIIYYLIIGYLFYLSQKRKFYFLKLFLSRKFLTQNINKRIVAILLIIVILLNINYNNKLVIHMVDVGQGDCTVITTPNNKNIVIDGGDEGNENTVISYLLDRGITKIDYMIISHFDSDHSFGCAKMLESIKVSNIILSKQIEESTIYRNIVSIAKDKNIKLIYVSAGNVLNIDNMKFSILHPQKVLISENAMNNNSIVCKLEYKSFSMLFTGDIEKVAEEFILNKNINLKADVLKVAHHRI